LVEAAADFDTPIGGLRAELVNVQFYPEGLGIAQLYYLNRDQMGKVGILMAGHRNISFYTMQNSQPIQKATSDLGFRAWMEFIIDGTSGYELGTLSSAVAEYWMTKELSSLSSVLRHHDESDREFELEHLTKVIASTQVTYWRSVHDWLDDKLPSGLEEVMLSGGTAQVLKPDFLNYFKVRLPSRSDCGNLPGVFNEGVFQQIPQLKVPHGYQSRMADVYCLHEYLMKSTTKATINHRK
jgi:hypothetical protein